MWKKILYIGIAVIIGIMVFVFGYNSNQINHLTNLVNEAIDSGKYYEVPKIWEGCFDTKSVIVDDTDKLDIEIYPATSERNISYGSDSTRYLRYEKAYYFYIFKPKFSYTDVSTGSDSSYNRTGFRFYSGEKCYDYYFIVSDTINSSEYIESPRTKEEALLNATRNVTITQETWGFMRLTLGETELNQIRSEIGGDIDKLQLMDSTGVVVYEAPVDLNFNQAFFTDLQDLFDNYNIYLDEYLAANDDKDKINQASDKFNEFYEPWFKTFDENKETTGYTFRHDDAYLAPGSLLWQTIGIEALYLLVVAILYILLFHFKAIKNLFSKDHYKDYGGKNDEILINGKWVKTSGKGKPVKEEPKETIQEAEIVEDTLEEVTASEITQPKEVLDSEASVESKDTEPEMGEPETEEKEEE